MKPRVAFYGLTGCAGCQLSFIFNEEEILKILELVDVCSFPFIREREDPGEFDITFMEGLVASKDDLARLKEIRGRTKKLVALGACAHTGCIPAYRKYTLAENYEHLYYEKRERFQDVKPSAIHEHVHVDYTIPGCPPHKQEILECIQAFAQGIEPKPYNNPVCVECRRNNNDCLLIQGKPCLGPITRGGCNAVCTNGKFECWGCRGPTSDADFKLMVNILRDKGFSDDFIRKRMRSFAGVLYPGDEVLFE
jgi:sulfhydrogenase subunit delta